jgi:hypothetical protein
VTTPKTFDEAWARYGGSWTVTWPDGTTVKGQKAPDKPKLRVFADDAIKDE